MELQRGNFIFCTYKNNIDNLSNIDIINNIDNIDYSKSISKMKIRLN